MYGKLTSPQWDAILKCFDENRHLHCDDNICQLVSIIAEDVLCPDIDEWNSAKGSDAFAAVLAVLMMHKRIMMTIMPTIQDLEIEPFQKMFDKIPNWKFQ